MRGIVLKQSMVWCKIQLVVVKQMNSLLSIISEAGQLILKDVGINLIALCIGIKASSTIHLIKK